MTINEFIRPKSIKPTDTIAIISTARAIETNDIQMTIDYLKEQKFNVILGSTIGARDNQFAGDTSLRTSDLQAMLDSPQVKAIICARGGYGTAQILQHIDWEKFTENPKWIVGYSDVTALHNTISHSNIMSLHGIMPININNDTALKTFEKTLDIMKGATEFSIALPSHPLNKPKEASGILTGGNLSMIYSLRGTPYDIIPSKRILFIEDLDEYLYHIDRMIMNFCLGGFFESIEAIVVGGMTDMNDNTIPYGKTAEEIIYNNIPDNVPLFFGASFGHFAANEPMVCGAKASIGKENNKWMLKYSL